MLVRLRVDRPKPPEVRDVFVTIGGWYLADRPDERIAVTVGGTELPVSYQRRPDVERVHPTYHSSGFSAFLDLRAFRGLTSEVEATVAGNGVSRRINLPILPEARALADGWDRDKLDKLSTIRGLLQCPTCQVAGTLFDIVGGLRCERCGDCYEANGSHFNMLHADLRAQFDVTPNDRISQHPYGPESRKAIHHASQRGGLTLDVGAGFRPRPASDIVCLEIAAYPSTDVVGVGQRLPFADGSFDAVVSKAVFEHVTDPFACAAELVRVTAPGGRIFCSAPLLAPEHAFPHHYYNMTRQGLVNLFRSTNARVVETYLPLSGHPAEAVAWILNVYHAQLPPELTERFMKMTVADLLALRKNRDDPMFAALSEDGRRILAATTAVMLEKD